MERIECVVIGCGVVGLALARELALAGREVAVLEAEDRPGTGTSSRSSEVIHAGMHYPQGSLKARLCVAGNRALYEYCRARRIGHRRCGKLIVATGADQLEALRELQAQAAVNGIGDLAWLDRDQAGALEPGLECAAALLSPSTGIIDSHGLMQALLRDAEDHGAAVVFRSPVVGGRADGLELELGGAGAMRVRAGHVFNCAGLRAAAVARSLQGIAPAAIPRIHYAKGNYYALAGAAPFSRLVYPLPEAAGLGVHLTLDLGGQARFGPDVEWVDEPNYEVDPARSRVFYPAIRRYWPGLPEGALQPAYAGIRPKLQGPGEAARDFLVQGQAEHGVAGLWNLLGIESPGLTACLALARLVALRAGLVGPEDPPCPDPAGHVTWGPCPNRQSDPA
jgi:L-2-hydroxyglutarate oxidase LhgO